MSVCLSVTSHLHFPPHGPEVCQEVAVGNILKHEADWLLHRATPNHVHNKGTVVLADFLHDSYLPQELPLELI